MKLRIKSTSLTIKCIGWLQLIGGITGLGLLARLLMNTGAINGPILLIFVIGISLFLFSIYTGTHLLIDKNKKQALTLSMVNQALQFVQWGVFGYGFSYSSGAEILVGFQGFGVKFNFSALLSTFNMTLNSGQNFYIRFNLLAIFIIYVLADILEELKKPATSEENHDIVRFEEPDMEAQNI
ncbi:MAG: hypothetical protein INR69_12240 [Mucilaginibacter polytrichastri]|nr:hypothetical protein [Mucilaginibacter polytrichastri]